MAYPRSSVDFSATTCPFEGSTIFILCPTNPAPGSAYFLTSFQETAFTWIWPVGRRKSAQPLNITNIAMILMNHISDGPFERCLKVSHFELASPVKGLRSNSNHRDIVLLVIAWDC